MSNYNVLIFEPKVAENYKQEEMLWRASLFTQSYSSIQTILLNDIIEYDNRKRLKDWIEIFENNGIDYFLNFESEYSLQYVITEKNFSSYSFDLYACDVRAAYNKIEISNDYILLILSVLSISKNQSYNPILLQKKIANALEIISFSEPSASNLVIISHLHTLDRLVDVCIDYEVDVKCTIEVRA